MAHFEIDISELDRVSLAVLRAALGHARKNRNTRTHLLPLEVFYQLADLGDEVYIQNFVGWLTEIMKIAVYSPDNEAQVWSGWPVFNSFSVTRDSFEFAINANALDAEEFPKPRG
jgi:hypothetical protein